MGWEMRPSVGKKWKTGGKKLFHSAHSESASIAVQESASIAFRLFNVDCYGVRSPIEQKGAIIHCLDCLCSTVSVVITSQSSYSFPDFPVQKRKEQSELGMVQGSAPLRIGES